MKDLKEYVVTVDGNQWNNLFIVSAKNSKDAINVVYEEHFSWRKESDKENGFRPTAKYELHARSVDSLHSVDGRVICLN